MAVLDNLISYFRYKEAIKFVCLLQKSLEIRRVLDIGAGKGEFARMLKSRGFEVKTLDKEGGDFMYDLEKPLPFKDKEFDLVVSLAVIEHINNYIQLLNEMKRIAKSVILTTPSPKAKSVLELLARTGLANKEHIFDHKVYLDKKTLESYGFKVFPFELGLNYLGVWGLK